MWFDFLFEGQHRIGSGDLHAGVLCLAIAVESIVRVLLTKHLKRPANDKLVDLLNRANIGSVLDRWPHLGFWSSTWQAATDLPKIKRLFDLRNGIMHHGHRRERNSSRVHFAIKGGPDIYPERIRDGGETSTLNAATGRGP